MQWRFNHKELSEGIRKTEADIKAAVNELEESKRFGVLYVGSAEDYLIRQYEICEVLPHKSIHLICAINISPYNVSGLHILR